MKQILFGVLVGLLLLAPLIMGNSGAALAQNQVSIDGVGATFLYPDRHMESRIQGCPAQCEPELSVYRSGGGIRQFTELTVGFGATDAPLT